MSSVPETPTVLGRLRAETRPLHEAVEQNAFNQALSAGSVTAADTTWFLAKLHGFVQPYEAQLRAHAALFGPAWQLERRYRAALLLQDLRQAGYAGTPPQCPAMPPLDTFFQLLGALYVLEGSTLGGQVIARQLARQGIASRSYFLGQGEQTGPLWKSFCQQLEAAAASATDQSCMVASAVHTFHSLSVWLHQP